MNRSQRIGLVLVVAVIAVAFFWLALIPFSASRTNCGPALTVKRERFVDGTLQPCAYAAHGRMQAAVGALLLAAALAVAVPVILRK